MKYFLKHTCALLGFPLTCLWVAAFIIDPEHVFNHTLEMEMADILRSNNEVSGVCNINERAFKRFLVIKDIQPREKKTIFLGSSRVMTLDSMAVEPSTPYLNLGMPGACYYDILGCFLLLKEADAIEDNHLVLGLDPWMLTSNQKNTFSRWMTFLEEIRAHGHLTTEEWIRAKLRRLKKMLAPSTVHALLKTSENCNPQMRRDPGKNTYSNSGTLTYPDLVVNKSLDEAKKAIERYTKGDIYNLSRETGLKGFEANINSFLSLRKEVEKLGGSLTFVLNPYPAQVYDYLRGHIPLIEDAEIAARTELNAKGNWMFSQTKFSDSEAFFDGMHLRPRFANQYYGRLLIQK